MKSWPEDLSIKVVKLIEQLYEELEHARAALIVADNILHDLRLCRNGEEWWSIFGGKDTQMEHVHEMVSRALDRSSSFLKACGVEESK